MYITTDHGEGMKKRWVRWLSALSTVSITGLLWTAHAVEMRPIPAQQAPGAEPHMEQPPTPPPEQFQMEPYIPPPEADMSPPPPPTPSSPPPARAAGPTRAPTNGAVANQPIREDEMLFNFQDADIQAVVKTVAQLTGRNFLLDPRVKGRVTIISAKPVSKAAAYEVFISALKAQGFSAVEGPGGIVKLVPEAEAKQGARVSGTGTRVSDQWVTQVVEVQYANAPQLIPLLRPLMSPSAMLSVYAPGNILVMTDTAASIRSVMRVIEKIDRHGSAEITVIPLRHASVVDVAQMIGRFTEGAQIPGVPGQPAGGVPGGGGGDARLLVVPDLRTNSLLVRSENPGRVTELRSLVEKLDVPAKPGGQTHVVYLRNAEATKLAEVLRGLLAGEARAAGPAGAAQVPGAPPVAGAARAAEASQIQADEANNALIISASDAVYNNLRSVIEKLDQRRAQVYVEALVLEVAENRSSQFGIQWATGGALGNDGDKGGIVGLTNFTTGPGIISTVVSQGANLANASGLTLGFVGKEIRIPDNKCNNPPCMVRGLGALVRALEGDSHTNILSTPNLVTLDNAEAKIVVGQNVPFVTGSFAQATGTGGGTGGGAAVNPFQTIERKDVGLTLKIKPQIAEGSVVKLAIFQELSSVARAEGAADLLTNKRSIETTVLIDDSNIMVLGGLIEDRHTDGESKVPLLGDIPFFGRFFKFSDRSRQKTNLMVFLRPVILRSARDSYSITTDRYDVIEAHRRGVKEEDRQGKIMNRFKPIEPKEKEKSKSSDDGEIGSTDREGKFGPSPGASESREGP